jgi:hypothetical protein
MPGKECNNIMLTMMPAPIVLFVYNRLSHTMRTIEALQKNLMACESILYIYSDGPKNEKDAENVTAVRNYVKGVSGFADVIRVERQQNQGLASSIMSGVTEVVSKYGRIVVLEDDIITSPFFLTYMNEALCKYQDDEQVMHIAGYMLPINSKGLKETVFYRNTSCWGWGTWESAWDKLENNACLLKSKFTEEMKYRFNIDGAYDSWSILDRTCLGKADSWAILWYASVFLSGGVCLHPSKSLTKNIGHDGSGTNCDTGDMYNVDMYEGAITEFEEVPIENVLALKRIKRYILISRIPTIKAISKRFYKMLTGTIR